MMALTAAAPGPSGAQTNEIPRLFDRPALDEGRLREIEGKPDPSRRYVIAITPRSGSSYLCNTLKKTRRLGRPNEALNERLIPEMLRKMPGRTPDEYLRNVFRARMSGNRVSGIKASWFQFENFTRSMARPEGLAELRYVYLTRRDLAAQAVSLYKATASGVFHSNVDHSDESLGRLAGLEYSFEGIREWHDHIAFQEKGWRRYFYDNRIFPLSITYEEIEEDVLVVMKRIAAFVGVAPGTVKMPEEPSVFEKVRDARNLEWARRFERERDLGPAERP